jgi:hypothetical protein
MNGPTSEMWLKPHHGHGNKTPYIVNFGARWKYVGPFMHHMPWGGDMLYLWTGMYMEFSHSGHSGKNPSTPTRNKTLANDKQSM